ncbi:MAG: PD-(D/E)XK nuclease family protein [Dehalococcoidia bacterium]|nr:PD-(D/E)XK nuclease family protein [Dehalococcoidia bacterium]
MTHTKVRTFLRCRKQYWFSYVSGLPYPEEEEGPAIVIGQAVHRAMQELTESGDPEVARQRVDAYLRMPKHAAAGPDTEHYATAMAFVERGIEAHEAIDSQQTWGELDTWAPWPSRDLVIRTRADRVDLLPDGTYQVIDWKTGRFDDEAVLDEQLDLAHVALRVAHRQRIGPEDQVRALAWNLRTGTKRERLLGRADAQATMGRALGLATQMQAETEFRAAPGPHCVFCRWQAQCDEGREVTSGAPAEELFGDLDGEADDAPAGPWPTPTTSSSSEALEDRDRVQGAAGATADV